MYELLLPTVQNSVQIIGPPFLIYCIVFKGALVTISTRKKCLLLYLSFSFLEPEKWEAMGNASQN